MTAVIPTGGKLHLVSVGLALMLAVAGCTRSPESQGNAKQGAEAQQATPAPERVAEPPQTADKAVPSGLTELPSVPRRETPLGQIGNNHEAPAQKPVQPLAADQAAPTPPSPITPAPAVVSKPPAIAPLPVKKTPTEPENPLRDGVPEPTAAGLRDAATPPVRVATQEGSRAEAPAGNTAPALPAQQSPAAQQGAMPSGQAQNPSTLLPPLGQPLPPIDEPPAAKATTIPPETKMVEPGMPAGAQPTSNANAKPPFDPIKANGPIFQGWLKPRVAFVITGMEHGYIEPCGCAGMDRMKGGMARRYTLFKELRRDGWPLIGIDVGGIANGFGQQAEMKFRIMIEGKRQMGYDAIAFGTDELRLPAGELLATAASVDGKPSLFIAANVGLFGFDPDRIATMRVLDAGGMKVGITAVLGKQYQKAIQSTDIEFIDPETALQKIVPELRQKADYLVLLAHATRQESVALAQAFPAFNVVVTADSYPEPPAKPTVIEGMKTLLIEVGHKGMDAIVLGLFNDPQTPWRYQRVPLDSRFAQAPEMKLLMAAYQDQVKALGFSGLGSNPLPHPQCDVKGRFVGSKKCESCHEASYKIWKKSGHGRAYDTLVKLDPPRNFDPECVSCHVTGWHPTKFFPYKSGFESVEKTPLLAYTGCEDCHGPGEKHVAVELSGSEAERQALRKAMVLTKAEAEKDQCVNCHDGDNSPDFNFKTYWPKIEHKEKE